DAREMQSSRRLVRRSWQYRLLRAELFAVLAAPPQNPVEARRRDQIRPVWFAGNPHGLQELCDRAVRIAGQIRVAGIGPANMGTERALDALGVRIVSERIARLPGLVVNTCNTGRLASD